MQLNRCSQSSIAPRLLVASLAALLLATALPAQAQHDPGVRGGAPGAGGATPGIQVNENAMFLEGRFRMTELEATCDGCSAVTPGSNNGEDPLLQTLTNSAGLGARLNADSCMVCHSQPSIGGTAGFLVPNPKAGVGNFKPVENPMFDLIPHRNGATNVIPPFITQFGPIREMRLLRHPDGTPDGGVHQLFTVAGRTDDPTVPGCNSSIIPQPNFAKEIANKNIGLRIPLQEFGLGLIDSIQDREIVARHDATAARRATLGVKGAMNRSANDGTISRFGWKAQNKSLTIFSGEAYNVEMGVTNELFPQPVEENAVCNGPQKPLPNDVNRTALTDVANEGFNNPVHLLADWMQFMLFMRFLDGPTPVAFTASAARGQHVFDTVGCTTCHTPQMVTAGTMNTVALQGKPVNLYSDLLIHHMGPGLADHITQGAATGDMFRPTPLWGIGQRRFFLHDGRTSDLVQAIQFHASHACTQDQNAQGDQNSGGAVNVNQNPNFGCRDLTTGAPFGDSEANAVIHNFNGLVVGDKQAVIDFLRAL